MPGSLAQIDEMDHDTLSAALRVPPVQRCRPFRAAAIPAGEPGDGLNRLMDAGSLQSRVETVAEQPLAAYAARLVAAHRFCASIKAGEMSR